MQQAEGMYEALQAQGIQPNTYILNAMLNVYAECGNAARAQDLYACMTAMPGYGNKPTRVGWCV